MKTIQDKFWSKVDKSGECWIWKGETQGSLVGKRIPYGRFVIYGGKRQRYYAHRLAYELANGAFNQKMHVCHTCDNPLCVNPEHLFLGTHTDNMKDMFAKGRRSLESIEIKFSFISPRGDTISGSNLNRLCRDYGLHYRSMNLLHRGLKISYKGWRKA